MKKVRIKQMTNCDRCDRPVQPNSTMFEVRYTDWPRNLIATICQACNHSINRKFGQ